MLINVSEGEECRIALLENGRLEELYMERTSATSHVGNIYKGRVTNVEASIQAAFVDFGLGRNGFLHISDVMPFYFGKGEDFTESVGRKIARRDRPPIQRCLRRGDEIIVQIIKEGIGTKGPTLSTYVSIPGRILVMMPGMSKFGVSRKIEDEDERRRLRQILDSLKPIDDVGFIIRTAGIEKTKAEIQRDLTYLTRLWQNIEKKRQEKAPVELYTEGDLVTRTVRDVFSTDLDRIVVDNEAVGRRVKEFFRIAMPRATCRVELYEGAVPLFHQAGLERELEQMYSRHVPLPSGGSLVIDSTEAVVAIDVNSGKFRDHNDAEMTAFKTDMEAADEIPRQLKLRDLGGVIICDFIDLRFERHRRELEKKLHDNFKNDRAKTKVLRMSQFGIIELTRQRMRPSLKRSIYFDCPHCKGAGLVKTPESMSLDVMRRLAIAAHDPRVHRVELALSPDVGVYVLNKKRVQLTELERLTRKRIIVRQDIQLGLDEVKIDLFDTREGHVYLQELGMSPEETQEDSRRHQGRGRDRRNLPGRGQPDRSQIRPGRPEMDQDDFENVEEVIEDRELSRELPGTSDLGPPISGPPVKPVPRLPIGKVVGRLIEIDEAPIEEETNVIDVDEPHEPLGDGPEPYEEDDEDADRHRDHRRDRQPQWNARRGPQHGGPNRGGPQQRGPQQRDPRDRGPQDRGSQDRGNQRGFDPRGRQNQRPGFDPRNGPPRNQPPRPPIHSPANSPQDHEGDYPAEDFHEEILGEEIHGEDRHDAAPGTRGPIVVEGNDGPRPGEPLLDADGQPRRRRRRRGRRGRGRNRQEGDQFGQADGNRAPGYAQSANPEPHGDWDEPAEGDESDLPVGEHTHEDRPSDEVRDERLIAEERDDALFDAELSAISAEASGTPPQAAPAAEGTEPAADEEPKKRRRSRGGRRHRGRRDGAAEEGGTAPESDEAAPPADEPAAEAEPAEAEGEEKPAKGGRRKKPAASGARKPRAPRKSTAAEPQAAATPEPPAPVARSGSTDRHLVIDDIPVDPEPVRRPRSIRDLDAVPDDFD